MAGMLVLTTMQPIVGVDIHTSLPPIPPAPLPHVVVWGTGLSLWMGLPLALTASHAMAPNHPQNMAKPVAVGPAHACGRGHDAGAFVAHIAGNTLLPIVLLGSASKAEFGSGTVMVGQGGERMAVNLLIAVNIQLHCDDPVPMPTGITIATASNMVYANLTWMDFLNGLVHMIVDVIIVALLNLALAGIGKVLGKALSGEVMKGLLGEMGEEVKSIFLKLDDIFFRKLSSGKRVIDWSRLTPKGFAEQVSQTVENVAVKEFRKDLVMPELKSAAKTWLPAWLVGSPTGASATYQPTTPDGHPQGDAVSGPGAHVSSAADTGVDHLVK